MQSIFYRSRLRARAAVPADGRHEKPWGPGGPAAQKERAEMVLISALVILPQRPTLPHRFSHAEHFLPLALARSRGGPRRWPPWETVGTGRSCRSKRKSRD